MIIDIQPLLPPRSAARQNGRAGVLQPVRNDMMASRTDRSTKCSGARPRSQQGVDER